MPKKSPSKSPREPREPKAPPPPPPTRDELAVMRVVEQACTSLDLSRRRWVKLSDSGKAALSGWANSMQRLAYAETDQPWGLLADCEGVLEGVGARARTSLGTHRTQLEEAMRGLEAAVGAMRAAVDTLRQRVDAAAAGAAAGSVAVERASQVSGHAERIARTFEQEIALRRAIAGEALADPEPGSAGEPARAERAKLYLSAWVLGVYVEPDELEELIASGRAFADPNRNVV